MRILILRGLQLALLAVVAGPSVAAADPIRITSGFVRAGAVDPRAQFAFQGEDFSLAGFAQSLSSTLRVNASPAPPGRRSSSAAVSTARTLPVRASSTE